MTTEQLSAFIDRQVSGEEQGAIDEHLKVCPHCQLGLKDLRQTVMLLEKLPQPQLPRSFALSADVLTAPQPSPIEYIGHVRTSHARMRTTFQVISALAAVVGIVFLLSATPHPLGGTSTASSSSTASSGAAAEAPGSSASTGQKSFHALATSDAIVTPANQSTENLATPAESNPKPISPSPPPANKPRIVPAHAEPPATTSLNLNQPEWRVVIGIALLCLGFIGLIVLSLQHRRLNATGT